jgi:hypothetical protein
MADAREAAKAIYESDDTGALFSGAEDALTAAWRSGDETAQQFWRSVFREFCNLIGEERFQDDIAWHYYEDANSYANGASPNAGPAGEREKRPACEAGRVNDAGREAG